MTLKQYLQLNPLQSITFKIFFLYILIRVKCAGCDDLRHLVFHIYYSRFTFLLEAALQGKSIQIKRSKTSVLNLVNIIQLGAYPSFIRLLLLKKGVLFAHIHHFFHQFYCSWNIGQIKCHQVRCVMHGGVY